MHTRIIIEFNRHPDISASIIELRTRRILEDCAVLNPNNEPEGAILIEHTQPRPTHKP